VKMSYLPRLLPTLVVDEFEIECVDMAWDISAEGHTLAINPYLDVFPSGSDRETSGRE